MKLRKFSFKEDLVGTEFDKNEIIAITKLLKSKNILTRGVYIEKFERQIARYCNQKYAIAVSSCGAALNLSSKILSLKPGDEVICQGNMFWSAINHLIEKKVKIVCADIDKNLNISVPHVQKIISKKTKAIYIMHHGGHPCDLTPLRILARKFSIPIVEDCAHALGSLYKGKKIGANSDLACFSFSTLKNISTLGEGGMIVTNNKTFANRARLLRTNFALTKISKDLTLEKKFKIKFNDLKSFTNVGNSWEDKVLSVDEIGGTYRMNEAQAVTGIYQLKKINKLINKRKKIVKKYNNFFKKKKNLFEIVQCDTKKTRSSNHLYSFLLKKNKFFTRNELANELIANNIEIKIRFSPIHFNNLMRFYGCKISNCKKCFGLPSLEDIWLNRQMSLPLSPHKNDKDIEKMFIIFSSIIDRLTKYND
jgi:perosamine synthetase